jgi:hypothetical protein
LPVHSVPFEKVYTHYDCRSEHGERHPGPAVLENGYLQRADKRVLMMQITPLTLRNGRAAGVWAF